MTGTAATEGPHLRRTLGPRGLLLFGVCVMFPIAPAAVYGSVTQATGGHMALAYLIAAVPMAFTAWSYGQMAAAHPVAGSAYAYTRHTFGPVPGFLAGWAVLLDYLLFQILDFIMIAVFTQALVPAVPFFLVVAVAAVLVTVANLMGIRVLDRVNTILVLVLFVAVAYFVLACIVTTATSPDLSFGLKPFHNPATFHWGGVLGGAAIAAFSFLGFDAMTTMAEETKDPGRTLPRATVVVVAIMAVVFAVQGWAAQTVFPDHERLTNPDQAFFDVALRAGGSVLSTVISLAVIVGALANAVDCQAGLSRVLYGMGRDGALPRRFFAVLNGRDVPRNNILLLGALGVAGAVLPLVLVINLLNFGALVAFIAVNLSVIVHFFVRTAGREPGDEEAQAPAWARWVYLAVPALGVLTCAALMFSLSGQAQLIGLAWLAMGTLVMLASGAGRRNLSDSF